jgi:hypothetical protein
MWFRGWLSTPIAITTNETQVKGKYNASSSSLFLPFGDGRRLWQVGGGMATVRADITRVWRGFWK